MTYHDILGVDSSATIDEITVAYRRLARKYHPDVSGGKTEEKFKEINKAYRTLKKQAEQPRHEQPRHEQPRHEQPRQRPSASAVRLTRVEAAIVGIFLMAVVLKLTGLVIADWLFVSLAGTTVVWGAGFKGVCKGICKVFCFGLMGICLLAAIGLAMPIVHKFGYISGFISYGPRDLDYGLIEIGVLVGISLVMIASYTGLRKFNSKFP